MSGKFPRLGISAFKIETGIILAIDNLQVSPDEAAFVELVHEFRIADIVGIELLAIDSHTLEIMAGFDSEARSEFVL